MRQIRVRLVEKGLRVKDLAEAARMRPAALSGILSGGEYVGPARRARIAEAVKLLGLDRPDDDEAAS